MASKAQTRTPAPQAPNPARAQKIKAFSDQLEARTDQIRAMLVGTSVSVDFFKQVALVAARETWNLLDCEPASVWSALYKAARDGLLPDGKDGKIIVRKQERGGKTVLTAGWQDMFGGLKKKIRRSKEVLSFKADLVYAEDEFVHEKGDEEFIRHVPSLSANRGPIIAAYAIAKLANGEVLREVMPIHEIYQIRDRYSDGWKAFKSGAIKDTPWASAEGEMAKKTVGRRLAKWLPMDTDLRLSVEHDDDDVLPGQQGATIESTSRPQLVDFVAEPEVPFEMGGEPGQTIEATAREVVEKDAAPPAEKAKVAEGSGQPADEPAVAMTHAQVVASLKARLARYPRDVREEIFEVEVMPARDSFSAEEFEELKVLVRGNEEAEQ